MTDGNKKSVDRTRAIIEGVVDLVAIIGLVTLAVLKVVDGATVVPLITLIAGASVGARLGGKSSGDGESGGGGTPASVLLLIFTPLLQALGRMARSSRVMLPILAVFIATCGGTS